MPFTHSLSHDRCIISCELTGLYDIKETQQLFREIAAQPECPEGWGVLVDVRKRQGAPTVGGIAALVMTLEALSSRLHGRTAFVTGFVAQYGMARMLEIRAEMAGLRVRAFDDESEALEWLLEAGVPALKAREKSA